MSITHTKVSSKADSADTALVRPSDWNAVHSGTLDHGGLDGLLDDDHTQYVKHSLATAVNDFLVASGAGVFVKKTLAEVKTLLDWATDIATHAAIASTALIQGHATTTQITKLDGIETGATKYPDTGEQAFLDADHTKLDGIATGANLYVHPNHSGDVTSAADGAQTIVNKVTMTATAPVTVSGTPTVIAGSAVAIAIPAATNAAAGHATAAHIAAIEANTAKVTNATHSGDATGDGALTIPVETVTYAKMQHVSATDKVLGRSTAGAGDVEEIACTAAGRALLDDANAAAQLVTLGDAAAAVAAVDAAGLILAAGKTVEYTSPTGSRTASGKTVTETAGINLVFGNACYRGTDGLMEKALADDAALTIPATHFCLATIAENSAGLFLTEGEVYSTADSWAFDVGKSVYLSAATAGLITKTMPTKVTGNQVQVLGVAKAADKIWWSPSPIVMEYA